MTSIPLHLTAARFIYNFRYCFLITFLLLSLFLHLHPPSPTDVAGIYPMLIYTVFLLYPSWVLLPV